MSVPLCAVGGLGFSANFALVVFFRLGCFKMATESEESTQHGTSVPMAAYGPNVREIIGACLARTNSENGREWREWARMNISKKNTSLIFEPSGINISNQNFKFKWGRR